MRIVVNNKTVFTGSTAEGREVLATYLNSIYVDVVSLSKDLCVLTKDNVSLGDTPMADRTRGC